MNESRAPGLIRPEAEERVEIDMASVLAALRRSLRWLLPLTIAVAVLAFVVLQLVPAKYRSESKVLIETSDIVYPGDARGVEEERALLDNEGIQSQVELLMSRDLLRRVAKRLDLAAEAEFQGGGGSLVSDMFVALGMLRDPGRSSLEERVLKTLYEHLDVFRVDGSRVITVRYTSRDAELSARVANGIVEEYLNLQSSVKRETTDLAATALETQIERLQGEVKEAQEKVEAWRSQAGLLLGADNQTLDQQQLGEISTQLSDARAAQSQAEARAKLIREQLRSGGSLESANEVLNSQLIQRLVERQVELRGRIAELSTTLLPNHPQIRALRSQLDDIDRQVRQEAAKIASGLENEASIQRERVASLNETLDELKARAGKSNEDQIRLRELEREAQVKAAQLDQLMTRYREADTRRNAPLLGADARVISRATVPLEPYSPKVGPITAILTVVTFLLGALVVVLGQFLSGRAFVSVPLDDEHEDAGAPYTVAAMSAPRETGTAESARHAHDDLNQGQWRASAGAMAGYGGMASAAAGWGNDRAAATRAGDADVPVQADEHMDMAVADAPAPHDAAAPVMPAEAGEDRPRRVAVLSVDSDEASQGVAFRLVREAAEEGVLPLFLEVRPDLADPEAVPGFAELLDGSASFAGVIYRDAASRAHVIESGKRNIDDDLAQAGRFELLMDAIDHTYDQVFFDLGLIDDALISAQILAMADKVVVASGGSPAGPELEEALRMLQDQTGAPVVVEKMGGGTRGCADMAA
uniref:exopolysaccharide transport family protein n=1 Tax=Stappia sp. TaxID=1870903 RepID=UPI003BADAD6E